ncbi:MAG: ribosome biogenesis/translation initiation ATPase RLI [Candidatus Hermodarchaeota archaeon]
MKKITVVDRDRCKPDSCSYRCIKLCPLNRTGKKSNPVIVPRGIKLSVKSSIPRINERICLNCNICVNACFNRAIKVVNIPGEIEDWSPTHVYESSNFKLFGLPLITFGNVTGIIGENGIGKTSILNILAGKLKPNGGHLTEEGFEQFLIDLTTPGMARFLEDVHSDKLRVALKPQNLAGLKEYGATPQEMFDGQSIENPEIVNLLQIDKLLSKDIDHLSGGELQRVAIAVTLMKKADVYLLDEPATFNDVKQRLNLVKLLQLKLAKNRAILIVEHDICVLDHYSDLVHILWGEPHVYGVVSRSLAVKKGLNSFLKGWLREENIHFRNKVISFKRTAKERSWKTASYLEWPKAEVRLGTFNLSIPSGRVYQGEILTILGENGLGKTTFANLLAGKLPEYPKLNTQISYKPQQINNDFDLSVLEFLEHTTSKYLQTKQWKIQLLQPIGISHILDRSMNELSGGETQRVYIAGCLAKNAELYILDEPSAFLDVLERTKMATVIRNQTKRNPNCSVISIEHDIQLADFIGDRIMMFTGVPAVKGTIIPPMSKRDGMNTFLKSLNITFRRDSETGRARINKQDSQMDRRQKELGEYYYTIEK